jgi:hypothetical protein
VLDRKRILEDVRGTWTLCVGGGIEKKCYVYLICADGVQS